MMIVALTVVLGMSSAGASTSTPIQQLRESEIAERLAQTEAKRLALELQMARARHAINDLATAPSSGISVVDELSNYQLVGVVSVANKTHIVLRHGEQLIRLVHGVKGPMELVAEVEAGRVRLQRFGHFYDLPLTERW